MSEIRAILLWCQSSMYELLRFPSENTLVALQGAVYGRIERVPTTVEFEGVEMEMWVTKKVYWTGFLTIPRLRPCAECLFLEMQF